MDYSFDTIINRKGSLSVKWNKEAVKQICGNPEAIPFWVADMDFQVAPQILEQARALAEHGIYGYPYANNQRQVFCRWAKSRHQMTVDPKQVVISQGVLNSLAILVEMCSNEGDGIIVPMPAYQPFVTIINRQQRTLLEWPLLYDQRTLGFSLDWAALDQLCSKAKILIFCSPHNPTGLVFSNEDLIRLCSIAKQHGVLIISDEIHADLSYTKHICILEAAEQTGCEAIACMAPSKTFNIAGEHYSVTLFNNMELKSEYVTRLERLFLNSTSTFATTVAIAAYEHGLSYLEQLLSYLQETVVSIDEFLQNHVPSIQCIRPEASFIALLDCSDIVALVEEDEKANPDLYNPALSPSGGLMSRFFGQRAGIVVNDGTWFGGTNYRNFVRFNYGAPRSTVLEALKRIEKAVTFLQETYQK